MLDQFFADIATGFSDMLGGPYQDAVLRWPGTATYDSGGSITTPGTPINLATTAQFEAPTEQMRVDPGFREQDMRLIVLRAGLDRELDTSACLIVTTGQYAGTWSIETCQGDSVGIGWECRARRVA